MKNQPYDKVSNEIASIRNQSNRDLREHEKRQKISALIIRDMKARGSLFNTDQRFFYFEKDSARLYPVEADSTALAAMILERYCINRAERAEYSYVLEALRAETYSRGRKVAIRRLAHYKNETGRLYISRFDGWVYRLNGRSIALIRNGTDGVFFWDDPNWMPYELYRGKHFRKRGPKLTDLVFGPASFSEADGLTAQDQSWLFSTWLRGHFFASILPTKPLVLVCGEKGSGKTSALRRWLKFLFGPAGEVMSLERDKLDGFVAVVTSQPVAVFDNVDEKVSWLPDLLAQLATGIAINRRKLYTTNESVSYIPQCFVGLTSRTPKFIDSRDDVLDRCLILQTERITSFKNEHELLERIAAHRNSLWTELLRGLNNLIANTPPQLFRVQDGQSRMADFAGFARAVARVEGMEARAIQILRAVEGRRAGMLLDDEPISIALELWLKGTTNQGREVTASVLQDELSRITSGSEAKWPYRSAHSLGHRLAHITTNLRERFCIELAKNSANQRLYRFWPKAETLNPAESQSREIQAA